MSEIQSVQSYTTLAGAEAVGVNQALSLEYAINNYNSDVVPEVDAMIKGFQEKGADRAASLLTSALFSAFFNLTQNESSYAGNMQQLMRDVAVNDLPVAKTGREGRTVSRHRITVSDKDFEYDSTDITEGSTAVSEQIE